MTYSIQEQVESIVASYGRLAHVRALSEYRDLYLVGMTSHGAINVMLALEARFSIVFPEQMQQRSTFQSVAAICSAVGSLLPDETASTRA